MQQVAWVDALANTVTDTVSPTVPTGFKVSWTASTDNVGVTGYNIYRNGAYIGTTTGTFFNMTGLAKNTSYNITVLAFDAAKNRSVHSQGLAVTTTP
jgi:chitodextrinase